MRNTFAIKFYVRSCKARKDGTAPVECSIIIRGDRVVFQLPKYCEPEKFKTLKPSDDIMIYIHNVENKLNEIYTARSLAEEPISPFILKDIYLNGYAKTSYTIEQMFKDGLALKLRQGNTTYKKYVIISQQFLELTGINPLKEAASVTRTDILAFIPKLEKIHKPQTVQKDLQHLKFFWNTALLSGKISSTPFVSITYSVPKEENIFLTQEEIGRIRDLELTDFRLEKIRDTFLFMCYTGLEYADVVHLRPEDVKTSQGGILYIKKKRIKTGVEYFSVLYEDAVHIYKLYNGKIPVCSCQKLNMYIKELTTMAGINKPVSTITARHSYATFLLNEHHIPLDVVSKMLGHTTAKQSATYAKMLETTVLDAVGQTQHFSVRTKTAQLPDDDIEAFQEILGI